MQSEAAMTGGVIAMITLDKPALPDRWRLLEELAAPLGLAMDGPTTQIDSFIMPHAGSGSTSSVMCIDQPIPADDLAWPINAAFWWPEARATLARHSAHLIVHSGAFSAGRVDTFTKHTLLVNAILEQLPATGVYWGRVVVSPDQFRARVRDIKLTGRLPLQLWINIVTTSDGQGGTVVSTNGLDSFGLLEIECQNVPMKPSDAYPFIYNLVHGLISAETPVADGEPIGDGIEHLITVRHAPSFRQGVGSVYRLEFGPPEPLVAVTPPPKLMPVAAAAVPPQRRFAAEPKPLSARVPGAATSFGRRR
jgi:Domain of unknown function (DUF4261)